MTYKAKIVVSSCLLGNNCRYDGKNALNEDVLLLSKYFDLIPICPEVLGGLQTPRIPSEILNKKIINKDGLDITKNYIKGSYKALEIANENKCKYAILKSKSPACGKGKVYDGSFKGKLIDGNGICAALLMENGIEVLNEKEINELLRKTQ